MSSLYEDISNMTDSHVDAPSSSQPPISSSAPRLSRASGTSSAGGRALNHIVGNFAMFGFGNHEAALFQTVKELVENGMDAAGLSCGRHCEIAVNIYRLVEERQRCVVEVLDNGQGMADPRAQLSCFHSDKAPNALARIPNSSSSSSISYSGATCDANRSVPGSSGASGEAGALCSGKFGVGLSTCILYSQIHTQTCARIVTKLRCPPDLLSPSPRLARVLDVSFDMGNGDEDRRESREGSSSSSYSSYSSSHSSSHSSGEVVVVESSEPVDMPGLLSGTKVQIAMPVPTAFDQVVADISTYFARIACMPGNDVTIRFSVNMSGSQSIRSTYSSRGERLHATANTTTTTASTTGQAGTPEACSSSSSSGSSVREVGVGSALRRALGLSEGSAHGPAGSGAALLLLSASGTARALPTTPRTVPRPVPRSTSTSISTSSISSTSSSSPSASIEADVFLHVAMAERPVRQSIDDGLPVQMWRYANNVPLVDADDDALSCALFASLRRAPAWSRHAMQLRMTDADQQPQEAVSKPPVSSISSGRGDAGSWCAFKNTPMSLRFTIDDVSAFPDAFRVRYIVLVVNIRARNIPYTTMRKTSVGRCAEITKAIHGALQSALSEAHRMLPQLFVDVRKLKGELMLRTSVPSVARSLSKVIFHSRDSAFQYECMRILSDLVTRTHSDSNYYDCGVSGGAAECSRGDQEVLELQALQDAATDAILDVIRRQARPERQYPEPPSDRKGQSQSQSRPPPCPPAIARGDRGPGLASASVSLETAAVAGDASMEGTSIISMSVSDCDACTDSQFDMNFSQYSQYL